MGTTREQRRRRKQRALQRQVHSPEQLEAIAHTERWELSRLRRDRVTAGVVLGTIGGFFLLGLAAMLGLVGCGSVKPRCPAGWRDNSFDCHVETIGQICFAFNTDGTCMVQMPSNETVCSHQCVPTSSTEPVPGTP